MSNEQNKQAEPMVINWERIARVQDAKLRAMCNEPGAFENLCEVLNRYEKANPAPAVAVNEQLLEALQDLLDVQNGPPLSKWKDEWESAVKSGYAAIAAAEAAKKGSVA